MKRIAIIGGGISGLTAAYELELARKRGADIDWQLYEATDRLGGIIETTRIGAGDDGFILEGGPDGWVSEKPWARDLAIELGLESDLIYSNDATRRIYILINGRLQPIPDRMRLMVPEDLSTLEDSPLFSASAKQAYADELAYAAKLREAVPDTDESVASFVRRHFGDEVLTTLAAPLLSGVFGGDVERLSVRAVMPAFVAMEREHGSLIAALQSKAAKPRQPIFTTLRNGMSSLVDALVAQLPAERIHLLHRIQEPAPDEDGVYLAIEPDGRLARPRISDAFDHIVLAVPIDVVRKFRIYIVNDELLSVTGKFKRLGPTEASSAILAALAWPAEVANTFTIPPGFGFLVPTTNLSSRPDPEHVEGEVERPAVNEATTEPSLLACTFVDQKFSHRCPPGGRIIRTFFGGEGATHLEEATDEAIVAASLTQLRKLLGPLPEPSFTHVRRLPRSLPQYEVDHLARMDELAFQLSRFDGLTLLGNAYHGVGLPDLIRDARAAARAISGS